MGDNEEHLCFMLFLDNYVQKKKERCASRNLVTRHMREILREFF